MNIIKGRSAVSRLLKFSTVDTLACHCMCIRKEAFHVRSTSFSIRGSKTKRPGNHVKNESRNHGFAFDKTGLKRELKTASVVDSLEFKVKGDPDVFGDGGNKYAFEDVPGDEGDKLEESFIENPPDPHSKLRTKQYADMIKKCISEKRFTDAFDVLETRMLKQDRVKPENYIYNLLISACGRWGYTKKAFQLYNNMKKRGLKPKASTYTALFNACSNSPWPEDGLKRAKHLREFMLERRIEFNSTHYHAMIKAFGRCGDLKTAFALVDEMMQNNHQLNAETFNFLLQACIADQEAGFRHGILVWRKMLQKNVKPDLFTYNLMLRCARDCNIGDSVVAQNVLEQISQNDSLPLPVVENTLMISSDKDTQACLSAEVDVSYPESESSDLPNTNLSTFVSKENRPNLLAAQPHLGNIIQISEITKPQDRLLLIGGFSGVLQSISGNGLTPDIKTFTLLLDCIPQSLSAENALLSAMKKFGIQYDIDFLNMLIKKRSMRFDYRNAREVLSLIQQARLHPDIITFGVLALGCQTEDEAKQLCMDMRSAGYRINGEILGAMLKSASIRHDFHYVWKIVNLAKEEYIKPNAQFLNHLENLVASCREILKNKDNAEMPEYLRSKDFAKEARKFMYRYTAWRKEVELEEEVHPWEQYRKKQSEDRQEKKLNKRRNSS